MAEELFALPKLTTSGRIHRLRAQTPSWWKHFATSFKMVMAETDRQHISFAPAVPGMHSSAVGILQVETYA